MEDLKLCYLKGTEFFCHSLHFFSLQCNRSNSLSPVDKLGQPRLTKLTRTRTDKKSEFLKMLKRDPVEEHDENCVEQEKVQQVVWGICLFFHYLFFCHR